MSFRFGWVRDYSYAEQQPFTLSQLAGEFLPGIPDNPAIGGGVPLTQFLQLRLRGFGGLPSQAADAHALSVQRFTFLDRRGKQTFKFGASIYLPMRNIFQDEPGMRGDLGFTGVFPAGTAPRSRRLRHRGDLCRRPVRQRQYTQLTNVYFVDQRLWMASGFSEDDWKVTPKLTLNLGLRYDFVTPPWRAETALPTSIPPGPARCDSQKPAPSAIARHGPNTTNFGPRFGVSYAVNDKTVFAAVMACTTRYSNDRQRRRTGAEPALPHQQDAGQQHRVRC